MKVKHSQKRIKNVDKKKFLLRRVDSLQKENNKFRDNKQDVTLSQLMYFALIRLLPNPSSFFNNLVKYPYELGGFELSLSEGKEKIYIYIDKVFYKNCNKYVTFRYSKFNIILTVHLDIVNTRYNFCGIDIEVTKYEWDFSGINLKIISDFDFIQMFSLMKTQKEIGKLFWE